MTDNVNNSCDCKIKDEYKFSNYCKQDNLVYKCIVGSKGITYHYIGSTENTLKRLITNHKKQL